MSQTSPLPSPAPAPDSAPAWRSLAPVALVLVVAVGLSVATGTFAMVGFFFAIVAMVMLHEAGHFVAAKWAGMKVSQFFVGFGPRLWSVRKGETEYGVKALPFGGYVKIVGMSNIEQDIDPADEPRTFRQQSYPRRMLVLLAGVGTHFVMAFLLLVLLWTAIGVPRADRPTTTIGSISRLDTGESPAQRAGFKVGDRIVSVDGRAVKQWDDVRPYIRQHPGRPITFLVDRHGQPVSLTAVPASTDPEGEQVGFLGIGAKPRVERVGPVTGVGRAGSDLFRFTTGTVTALASFFTPGSLSSLSHQVTGASSGTSTTDSANRPVSIVGVVRIAGQAAESGAFNVVYLLVLLNVFVGMLNLIPLLPFDGGHVAIATYERIRSRKGRRYRADMQKMMPVVAAVLAVLGVFMITTVWLDITHPVANPFR